MEHPLEGHRLDEEDTHDPDACYQKELAGYLLNAKDGPCAFLDRQTNLCTIYDSRPLICRLFDCEGEDRERLIELGILDRKQHS